MSGKVLSLWLKLEESRHWLLVWTTFWLPKITVIPILGINLQKIAVPIFPIFLHGKNFTCLILMICLKIAQVIDYRYLYMRLIVRSHAEKTKNIMEKFGEWLSMTLEQVLFSLPSLGLSTNPTIYGLTLFLIMATWTWCFCQLKKKKSP